VHSLSLVRRHTSTNGDQKGGNRQGKKKKEAWKTPTQIHQHAHGNRHRTLALSSGEGPGEDDQPWRMEVLLGRNTTRHDFNPNHSHTALAVAPHLRK
jgi:hypothetical protein